MLAWQIIDPYFFDVVVVVVVGHDCFTTDLDVHIKPCFPKAILLDIHLLLTVAAVTGGWELPMRLFHSPGFLVRPGASEGRVSGGGNTEVVFARLDCQTPKERWVIVGAEHSLEVDLDDGTGWDIGGCQVKASIQMQVLIFKKGSVPKPVDLWAPVPFGSVSIVDVKRHGFVDFIAATSNHKQQSAHEDALVLVAANGHSRTPVGSLHPVELPASMLPQSPGVIHRLTRIVPPSKHHKHPGS